MKKILLLLVLLFSATCVFAKEVKIGGLRYIVDTNKKEATVIRYKKDKYYKGDIVIPPSVKYKGRVFSVTKIGGYAFFLCRNLTNITIPNSVTTIGEHAFEECSYLTSVTIPNSVTSIGSEAFSKCFNLSSVTIPNSVKSIGYGAFMFCHLSSIIIPNSVTSIEKDAFSYSHLTSITIPSSVTEIRGNAFASCDAMTSIRVESGNANYDSRDNCNAIIETGTNKLISGCKKTIIPNSVTSIGEDAFLSCSLTSFTIPASVTSIEDFAFCYCRGLKSITIGNNVKSIGSYAFKECVGLKSLTIPNSVTSIGNNAFYKCTGLTSVTIPNSVTTIGSGAFANCKNLTSITLPNSITTIKPVTFSGCSNLASVTIPKSVTSIETGAFDSNTIVRREGENNSLATASSKSTSTSSYTPTASSSYTNPTPSSSLLYRGGFTGTGTKYIVGSGIVSYPVVSAYASIYTDRIEVTAGNSSRVLNFWRIENGNYFYGDNSYFWMFNPQSYALNEGTSDAVIMMGRTCSVCQGSLLCATCGGSGRVYDPSSRTGTSLCNTCGSSGRCWRCNGTGIF